MDDDERNALVAWVNASNRFNALLKARQDDGTRLTQTELTAALAEMDAASEAYRQAAGLTG